MSQTALTDFARIAQQLADALDKHRPTQGNQTLVVLAELSNQLPENNPLRLSIEQQMAKIAGTDFALDNQDLNKTLIILGTLKGRLQATDPAQDKIDLVMAKILTAKFDIVNGQQVAPSSSTTVSSESEPEPAPIEEPPTPKFTLSIPEPQAEPEPEPTPAPLPEPLPEPIPSPEPAPEPLPEPTPEPVVEVEDKPVQIASPTDAFADRIHTLQIALDQLPASTRQAFPDLKAVEDQGTVQAFAEHLISESNGDQAAGSERVKTELERISALVTKIEDAPAEADQFQVLYDQVDAKHKDLKTGVFSIFQSEYGGNARRFVVERTAQYAKYVTADESRQRMIEDLHKLIEQAQKSLGQSSGKANGKANDSGSSDKPAKSNNKAFFHG